MAKRRKQRRINLRDKRRAAAASAMPEVKRLVKKYGRLAVGNCLNKIRTRDKEAAKLAALRKQVAELQRGLR